MARKGLRKEILSKLTKDTVENALYSRAEWEKSGTYNTYVPILNILASGKINGGFSLYKTTYLPAPSTMGKTSVGYKQIANVQKKYGMFAILIETESRFNYDHAEVYGVDTSEDNFMVIQENNITDIKNAVINILDGMSREQRKEVFIFLDSWGGLVSNTTIEMAKKDKKTQNMQETKEKNQLAKYLCGSKCTVLVAGWTYENVGSMSSKKAVAGGTGIEYMPDTILQGTGCNQSDASVKLSDSQFKTADTQSQIIGKLVTFYTNKTSAGGKQDTKLVVRILKEGGIDPYYGLLDQALAHGIVKKEGNKFTNTITDKTISYEKNIYTAEFWNPIFGDVGFREYIERKFSFAFSEMMTTQIDFAGALD